MTKILFHLDLRILATQYTIRLYSTIYACIAISFCCYSCLLIKILFLLRNIEVQRKNLIITTNIKTTSYRRVSKNSLKITETQKLKNSKTQEKKCKRQINSNKLSKSKISRLKNTRLTIQRSRYYRIKEQERRSEIKILKIAIKVVNSKIKTSYRNCN